MSNYDEYYFDKNGVEIRNKKVTRIFDFLMNGESAALMLAAYNGIEPLVKILTGYGADPLLRCPQGFSSVDYAVMGEFDRGEFNGLSSLLVKGDARIKDVKMLLIDDTYEPIEIVHALHNNDSGFSSLRITREQFVEDLRYAYEVKNDERILSFMSSMLGGFDGDLERWAEYYLKFCPLLDDHIERIVS